MICGIRKDGRRCSAGWWSTGVLGLIAGSLRKGRGPQFLSVGPLRAPVIGQSWDRERGCGTARHTWSKLALQCGRQLSVHPQRNSDAFFKCTSSYFEKDNSVMARSQMLRSLRKRILALPAARPHSTTQILPPLSTSMSTSTFLAKGPSRTQLPPRPKPPPEEEIEEAFVKGSGPGGQKIVRYWPQRPDSHYADQPAQRTKHPQPCN